MTSNARGWRRASSRGPTSERGSPPEGPSPVLRRSSKCRPSDSLASTARSYHGARGSRPRTRDFRPRPHAQPSRRAHMTKTSARAHSNCSIVATSEPRRPARARYVAAREAFAFIRSRRSSSNPRTAARMWGTASSQVVAQEPRKAALPHVALVSLYTSVETMVRPPTQPSARHAFSTVFTSTALMPVDQPVSRGAPRR